MDYQALLAELRHLLDDEFPGLIRNVILFGSRVTGGADEDSDLDVLVVTRAEADWRMRDSIINACYAMDLKYDILTDVKILAESDLRTIKGRQPFVRAAFETGLAA